MFQQLGKLVGIFVGMMFSPTMPLLKLVAKDYFNFDLVLSSPQSMPQEMARFMTFAHEAPNAILFGLCPKMLACLVIGYAVVAFFIYAGGVLGEWTAQQFSPKTALE